MTTIIDQFRTIHCPSRKGIAALAAQSPRLGDLAQSHPVLFVALATGYGDPVRRAAAIEAALAGRRLRTVCDLAAIPYCLRSVPRDLCPVPLPHADWSSDASPVLAQFIPDDPLTLCNWVPAIFFANGAAGEAFAMWLAIRHELFTREFRSTRQLLPIALYAWFAQHPEHELHGFLPARWSARGGSRRLLNATRAWLYRIGCRIYLPGSDAQEHQAVPFTIGPFQAIELSDYRALLAEQQAMDNCLDRYGRRIASGSHAVFSLRTQTGEPVANFEVAIHAPNGPLISEIRGRSNVDLAPEIIQPVLRWVAASSDFLRRRAVDAGGHGREADDIFAELIAPYVTTHQEALASFGPVTLQSLESDLSELAKRLGMTNWPVRYERTQGV